MAMFGHKKLRVVVTGATGNVGTSLLDALRADDDVDSIVGIARRRPVVLMDKVTWQPLDVAEDDLQQAFEGADAVVHLAWLIQPARNQKLLWHVNVEGSRRVFEAARAAEVPALVYASSIGAYSPAPKDPPVDESWPVDGIPSAYYSRQKAAVEALLDEFEDGDMRIVRMRPALLFKREAALEQQRLFLGPYIPRRPLRHRHVPIVPRTARLKFQALHTTDAAEAYRVAIHKDVSGAFNLAADDMLDMDRIAGLLDARTIDVKEELLRALTDTTWRLRLQPSSPGWFDMAVQSPIMRTDRAKELLEWSPRFSALHTLSELIDGIGERSSRFTPPLAVNDVAAAR